MKKTARFCFLLLLIIVASLNYAGCSKLLGPSDQEVIKAVGESGVFKGGFGGLTLQSPVTVLEKGSRKKDGAWPVKVKATFTAYISKDVISAPMERTLVFDLRKTRENAGDAVWTASLAK